MKALSSALHAGAVSGAAAVSVALVSPSLVSLLLRPFNGQVHKLTERLFSARGKDDVEGCFEQQDKQGDEEQSADRASNNPHKYRDIHGCTPISEIGGEDSARAGVAKTSAAAGARIAPSAGICPDGVRKPLTPQLVGASRLVTSCTPIHPHFTTRHESHA